MTDKHQYAHETLTQLREEVGTSIFDNAIKTFMRQRLDNGAQREKRKAIPWRVIKRHYDRQRGICRWCNEVMPLIRSEIEADHINPNEKDFNVDSNIQVLHKKCNREKSAMSVQEQAKRLGTTFRQILREEG